MAKKNKFEYPKDMLKTAKAVAAFNASSEEWFDPKQYAALRLSEELAELSKELICYASRPNKTDKEMIAAETADVILRMEIFLAAAREIPLKTIRAVVEEKCLKYQMYMKNGEKDII